MVTARRRPIMVSRPAAPAPVPTTRRPGERVEAEVTELAGTDVHVKFPAITAGETAGEAMSGIIELREFSAGTPAIGSKHEVTYLDHAPGNRDFALLTFRQPIEQVAWDSVQVGDLIQGTIAEVNAGGVVVKLDGRRGFIPASQVSRALVKEVGGMLSQPIAGEVTRLNLKKKEFTLGLRHLFDNRIKAEKAQVFSQFEKGQKLDGKVVRVNEHGAFVDIGGVDGLLHISKIDRHKESSETELSIEVGAVFPVEILYVDEERNRIGLGFPREGRSADTSRASSGKLSDYELGEVVSGMVRRVDSSGLILMLEDRVEGWLPATHFGDNPPAKGAILKAKIANLDSSRGKIELEPADGGLGNEGWNPFMDVQRP